MADKKEYSQEEIEKIVAENKRLAEANKSALEVTQELQGKVESLTKETAKKEQIVEHKKKKYRLTTPRFIHNETEYNYDKLVAAPEVIDELLEIKSHSLVEVK